MKTLLLKNKKVSLLRPGFTLLEMLISLSITVIITAIIIMNLNNSLDLWKQGSTTSKSIQQTDLALHWIESDLRQLYLLKFAGSTRLVMESRDGNEIEYYLNGTDLLRIFKSGASSTTDVILSNVTKFRFSYRDRINEIIPDELLYPNSGISPLECYTVNLIGAALTVTRYDNNFDLWTNIKLSYRKTAPVRNVTLDPVRYYMKIQDAMADTDLANGHIIQVSAGTYHTSEDTWPPSSVHNEIWIEKSISLKGGYNNPEWSRNLSLPENETIIRGNQGDCLSVLVRGNLDRVLFEGFTVENAAIGISVSHFSSNQSGLFIVNCKFKDLSSGISTSNSSKITIANSEFTNNTEGVIISGDCDLNKEISIARNTFGGSLAKGNKICAIALNSRSNIGKVLITNNTITYNGLNTFASPDGAIVMNLRNLGDVTISNNLIANNLFKRRTLGGINYQGGAGGISLFGDPPPSYGSPYDTQPYAGKIDITNNIIENNTAEVYEIGGGAIYFGENDLTECKISNNRIENNTLKVLAPKQAGAAGICILELSSVPSALQHFIQNNEIIGNSTNFDSAGIYIGDIAGLNIITVSHNIIKDNVSTTGDHAFGSLAAAFRFNDIITTSPYGIIYIHNNLILNNTSTFSANTLGGICHDEGAAHYFHNNILTNQFGLYARSGAIMPPYLQYNIFYGMPDTDKDILGSKIFSNWNYYSDTETSPDITSDDIADGSDPFMNYSGGDYLLKSTSSCIDIDPGMVGEARPPGKGTTAHDAGMYGGNDNSIAIGNTGIHLGP